MIDFNYLFHQNYYKDNISTIHFVKKELGLNIYENAVILPTGCFQNQRAGGVALQDGTYLENSGLNYKESVAYPFDREAVKHTSAKAFYLGKFVNIWGHNITDNLRFLWPLIASPENYSNHELLYIADASYKLSDSFISLLTRLGIDTERLKRVTEMTSCSELVVPDECFFNDKKGKRYFTQEYRNMIYRIRSSIPENCSKPDYDKVYFTYRKYGRKYQIGEDKIEDFFQELGYRIISPEDYTLEEQLIILSNCKKFASTIGSCSHNCVFLREQAECILIPRNPLMNEYQLAVNELVPLNIKYADASLSLIRDKKEDWAGPYYLFVSEELAKCCDAYSLYENYKDGRFRQFPIYVLSAIWCRRYLEDWRFWDYYPEHLTCEVRKY